MGVPASESPAQTEAAPVLEYRGTQPAEEPVSGIPEPGRFDQRQPFIEGQTEGDRPAAAEPGRPQRAIPDDHAHGNMAWEEQVSLTYAQPPQDTRQEPAEPETRTGRVEPMGIQNLPVWAQDMLRRTGGLSDESFSGPGSIQFDAAKAGGQNGALPGGKRTAPLSGAGKQIVWTAPGYSGISPMPSMPAGPAQMVFRDRDHEPENDVSGRRGMDEREIRKTADKVYRLIEERLRKELRRGGR